MPVDQAVAVAGPPEAGDRRIDDADRPGLVAGVGELEVHLRVVAGQLDGQRAEQWLARAPDAVGAVQVDRV